MKDKLESFRQLVQAEQERGIIEQGYALSVHPHQVRVKMGRKYANIDLSGPSWIGKYMVDLATGDIFGIKGYGVIHRGHHYGTLDTINDWNWSGYQAFRKAKVAA